jgi:hypothetical protein
MSSALICSSSPLDQDLGETVLWRRAIARREARTLEQALTEAFATPPTLVVIDRDWPFAERLISELRSQGAARDVPILVVARGAASAREGDLTAAGADAILRLPVARGWDERLMRLVDLPTRRDPRLAVELRVDAQVADDLVTATVLNLSPIGMLVQSPVPLEIGREIDFAFRLPDYARLVSGTGRVVRQATPTQFGVEFLLIEDEDRERIRLMASQQQ